MARGDKIVRLPDDDDRVVPRNQDQRGRTGRVIDARKLEEDVERGLEEGADAANRGRKRDRTPPGAQIIDDDPSPADGQPIDQELEPEDQEEVLKLRRQLAREKRRADDAESRVNEAEGARAEALDAKSQSDLATLRGAKSQIEEQNTSLRKELSAAYAEGDFDRVAEINQIVTRNTVNLNQIENGILQIENAPKQREAFRRRGVNPSDEQKFALVTKDMKPAAKQWMRDNPEYYRDDRLLNRVIGAHQIVMTQDDPPEPNSEDYFEQIEEVLAKHDPKFRPGARIDASGEGNGDGDDGSGEALSGASQGRRRRSAEAEDDPPPPAAPVARNGRGVGGAGSGNGRDVRLTPDEQQAAIDSGLSFEEYARNKRALVKENRMGPGYRQRMH